MRYTHAMRYAQRLLTESGFVAVTVEPVDLRLEQSVAVPGFLVAAQKPA
jgi:predicted TPR repeat methyltransferase